ncbi:MAG: chemotaxis protein CheW [Thiohalobacterales bacterium]
MADLNDGVRSMWIPLRGVNMLLPSISVAEVSNYHMPRELPDTPEWLLGSILWRDQTVPVISLEVLCGENMPANLVYSRIMIINSIRTDSPVQFYAIVAAGLPRLMQFDENTADGMEPSTLDALQCRVSVDRATAVIPDLDYIQGLLEQHRDIG